MVMSKIYSERIRKNIIYLRQLYEISQTDLSERSGVGPSLLSKIEVGSRQAGFDDLDAIARVFGISLGKILEHDFREEAKSNFERYLDSQDISASSDTN